MATHSPHAATATELQAVLAAERSDQPFLLHRDEDGELRIVALDPAAELTIGRRDTNRVALTWDEEVSRVHCQIECVGGDWTVSDEGLSRNGTFVNEERIAGRRRLYDGEVVRVGATRLLFRAPADETGRTVTTAAKHGETPLTDRQRAILAALARPFVEARGLPCPPPTRRSRTSCTSGWTPSKATCACSTSASGSTSCRSRPSACGSPSTPCRPASCTRAATDVDFHNQRL